VPLADRDALVAIGGAAGVSGAEQMLASDAHVDTVKAEVASWKGKVNGVPFFVVKRGTAPPLTLSGGQPAEAFRRVFRTLLKK
jgi:predicted DsbA family dithiol-disulfide isomerase